MSKQALLAEVPLFKGCTKSELGRISTMAKRVVAVPGQVLTAEGEPGDRFFVIKLGDADVTIGGKRVRKLAGGGFFGEISLLDSLPRTATVTAKTPMVMYAVEADDFARFLDENPSVTNKMLKAVSELLRSVEGAPTYKKNF
jgi:CRP-like cAMP-binding protein